MTEGVAKWWPIAAALFVGAGGASSFFVTREQAEAQTRAEVAEARLTDTKAALTSCMATVDSLTGAKP